MICGQTLSGKRSPTRPVALHAPWDPHPNRSELRTLENPMSGSRFVYVTYIRTTPEKLWQALTTPEIIKQYRFGMSVESEWKVGSTWRMYADGSLMDSGEILESVSQKRLVMSWLCEWKPE